MPHFYNEKPAVKGRGRQEPPGTGGGEGGRRRGKGRTEATPNQKKKHTHKETSRSRSHPGKGRGKGAAVTSLGLAQGWWSRVQASPPRGWASLYGGHEQGDGLGVYIGDGGNQEGTGEDQQTPGILLRKRPRPCWAS